MYGSISQSSVGYRSCVSMCSYSAQKVEYMGVIPWLLPRIQAKDTIFGRAGCSIACLTTLNHTHQYVCITLEWGGAEYRYIGGLETAAG